MISYRHDAWGNLLPSSSDLLPGSMLYDFIGALGVRRDPDSGLLYMRNRWYEPNLQRFVSRDPKRGNNRYAYAKNNPTRYIDPLGLYVVATIDTASGTLSVTTYNLDQNSNTYQPGVTQTYNVFSGKGPGYDNQAAADQPNIGPVPAGTYFIGQQEDVSGAHAQLTGNTMWFPLINVATGTNGAWVQAPDGTMVWRSGFYIHPGSVSDGCVTFQSDTPANTPPYLYPESQQFDVFTNQVNSTGNWAFPDPTPGADPNDYYVSPYKGILYVK